MRDSGIVLLRRRQLGEELAAIPSRRMRRPLGNRRSLVLDIREEARLTIRLGNIDCEHSAEDKVLEERLETVHKRGEDRLDLFRLKQLQRRIVCANKHLVQLHRARSSENVVLSVRTLLNEAPWIRNALLLKRAQNHVADVVVTEGCVGT